MRRGEWAGRDAREVEPDLVLRHIGRAERIDVQSDALNLGESQEGRDEKESGVLLESAVHPWSARGEDASGEVRGGDTDLDVAEESLGTLEAMQLDMRVDQRVRGDKSSKKADESGQGREVAQLQIGPLNLDGHEPYERSSGAARAAGAARASSASRRHVERCQIREGWAGGGRVVVREP